MTLTLKVRLHINLICPLNLSLLQRWSVRGCGQVLSTLLPSEYLSHDWPKFQNSLTRCFLLWFLVWIWEVLWVSPLLVWLTKGSQLCCYCCWIFTVAWLWSVTYTILTVQFCSILTTLAMSMSDYLLRSLSPASMAWVSIADEKGAYRCFLQLSTWAYAYHVQSIVLHDQIVCSQTGATHIQWDRCNLDLPDLYLRLEGLTVCSC